MGSSSSKSSPNSPHAAASNDANIPTRRPPRRKESVGTAGHSISKGHAVAPAASLESSHATSQDRSSVSSGSRGRSQTTPTAQQRLQDIAGDQRTIPTTASKQTRDSGTPDRSRSPLPPLNVDTSAPLAADLEKLRTDSSGKSAASDSPVPYYLPSSHFGRPPRLPLPIEEEIHAPGSPAPGSPTISPDDFTSGDGQVQSEDDMPRSKSVLSSTTVDEDEDLDDVMYKTEDMNGPLVDTLLEWREGGDKVYVTGTFCNWVKKSRLHKNGPNGDPNTFSAVIGLPPGTHHLTYFVDGGPRTARHLPTAVDYAGSLVNYIEVPAEDTPQPVKAKDIMKQHQKPPSSPSSGGERRIPQGMHPPMVLPPPTPELKPAGAPSIAGTSTTASGVPTRTPSQMRPPSAAALKRVQEEKKKYHAEIPRFLLDWDAPEGSSRVQRAGAVMQTQPAPPSLPMFLTKSILSQTTPLKDDASVLAYPNHTVLNHLATSSIKDEVLATSATTRYKSKFVTTIVYRPTSDETSDETSTG